MKKISAYLTKNSSQKSINTMILVMHLKPEESSIIGSYRVIKKNDDEYELYRGNKNPYDASGNYHPNWKLIKTTNSQIEASHWLGDGLHERGLG